MFSVKKLLRSRTGLLFGTGKSLCRGSELLCSTIGKLFATAEIHSTAIALHGHGAHQNAFYNYQQIKQTTKTNLTMARIVIPRSPEQILALAKKVYAKHIADGASSQLNPLVDYNWVDNGPKVAQADDLNAQARSWRRKWKNCIRTAMPCLNRLKRPFEQAPNYLAVFMQTALRTWAIGVLK